MEFEELQSMNLLEINVNDKLPKRTINESFRKMNLPNKLKKLE